MDLMFWKYIYSWGPLYTCFVFLGQNISKFHSVLKYYLIILDDIWLNWYWSFVWNFCPTPPDVVWSMLKTKWIVEIEILSFKWITSLLFRVAGENSRTLKQVSVQMQDIVIDHFPPVMLNFMYPEDYPSNSPPTFSLSCKWLNVLQVCKLIEHFKFKKMRVWDGKCLRASV